MRRSTAATRTATHLQQRQQQRRHQQQLQQQPRHLLQNNSAQGMTTSKPSASLSCFEYPYRVQNTAEVQRLPLTGLIKAGVSDLAVTKWYLCATQVPRWGNLGPCMLQHISTMMCCIMMMIG